SVADLKKCVKLNDTGIFIWNSLSDGFGRDKILSEMCKKYNAVTPDDKTILSDDLDSFLDILTAYRVFERENDIITLPDNSKPHHLRINTISICINAPDEYVSDNFSIFRYDDNEDLSFNTF
ncbi:MAG: PqqD family protein, partial [Eubacterium sp.]|nr:PqqD family protein [Eubacterium sp.]